VLAAFEAAIGAGDGETFRQTVQASTGPMTARRGRTETEKWVFLETLAGSTCLMRGTIGDIAAGPEAVTSCSDSSKSADRLR
jgi:hypothetical protein